MLNFLKNLVGKPKELPSIEAAAARVKAASANNLAAASAVVTAEAAHEAAEKKNNGAVYRPGSKPVKDEAKAWKTLQKAKEDLSNAKTELKRAEKVLQKVEAAAAVGPQASAPSQSSPLTVADAQRVVATATAIWEADRSDPAAREGLSVANKALGKAQLASAQTRTANAAIDVGTVHVDNPGLNNAIAKAQAQAKAAQAPKVAHRPEDSKGIKLR
jgi:hypothetical protein